MLTRTLTPNKPYAVSRLQEALRHAVLNLFVIAILPTTAVTTLIAQALLTKIMAAPTAVRTNTTHLRHKSNAVVLMPANFTTARKARMMIVLQTLPT